MRGIDRAGKSFHDLSHGSGSWRVCLRVPRIEDGDAQPFEILHITRDNGQAMCAFAHPAWPTSLISFGPPGCVDIVPLIDR